MKRILIFAPNYLPATRYGGPVQSTHGLARALVMLGYHVDVLTTDLDGPERLNVTLDRPVELDGVNVHYCSVAQSRVYYSPGLKGRAAELLPQADVVHINGVFLWPGPFLARAARRLGKTLVISPRGMLVPAMVAGKSRLAKKIWIALQERANLAAAAAIHVTSESEADGLRAMELDLAPLQVIGNGVGGPDRLPTQAEIDAVWGDVAPVGCRVAFLSRLDWTKGVDLAIAATCAHENAVIQLAGFDQIGLRETFEPKLIRSNGTSCGAFLGPLDGMAKWAFLAGADVLLVPSVSESFGMSVAEAMLMGTPVIATEGVGASALLNKLDSRLVVPRDQAALDSALAWLLADHSRRKIIGEAAREMAVDRLSWKKIAEQMSALYNSDAGARTE